MATETGYGVGVGLELRLGLGCMGNKWMEKNEKKRAYSETNSVGDGNSSTNDHHLDDHEGGDVTTKSKKNQVVGWPPVCSYRKKASFNGPEISSKMYVKVRMDGAPILRKIDLTSHTHYSQLLIALHNLFHFFGIHGEALKDVDSSEFVPIYEDKDGDWMLVGDVPWEMFTESCKRLRIMKRADVKGIGLHVKSILKGTKNLDE